MAAPLESIGSSGGQGEPRRTDGRGNRTNALAIASLLVLAGAVVLSGQIGLDLLSANDLREAEVAREMLVTGDCVVPHLAGLPFVEKPPGFPFAVAMAYKAAGGPSIPAARLVTAAFSLLSLAAVFLLGKRIAGSMSGAVASVALATAVCFCRTAHEILLDNALTAAMAWGLFFTWSALDTEAPSLKRRLYAGALFSVGLSFLFKGFVGPAIYSAGCLGCLMVTRRWSELRHALHPLGLAAFLVPVLVWVIPFVLLSPRDLLYEFFIANHFGRAVHSYESHSRPVYFYALTVWAKFAPGSLLLPFAAWAAWKGRHQSEGRASVFLLSFSVGATALLSLSSAKDDSYLLPVYPALACLVASWAVRLFEEKHPAVRWAAALLGTFALVSLAGLLGFGAYVNRGIAAATVLGLSGLAAGAATLVISIKRGNSGTAGWASCCLFAIVAILCCVHPLSTWYVGKRDPRPALQALSNATRDFELLLFDPDDRLRGGCGLFRGRTTEEVRDPKILLARLRQDPSARAAIWLLPLTKYHPELLREVESSGVILKEEQRVCAPGAYPVGLYSVRPGQGGMNGGDR